MVFKINALQSLDYRNSELTNMDINDMETVAGGGLFSFVTGVMVAIFEAGYSAGTYIGNSLR